LVSTVLNHLLKLMFGDMCMLWLVVRRVREIAKSDCSLRHVYPSYVLPSVCPHGTSGLPLDGFLWNLMFEYYSKICRENLSFIKIWQ
jgi:hypothetical protein